MLVTSFEEAAQIRGIDVVAFEKGFDFLPEEHREGIKALSKICIVNDELNKDQDGKVWTPDFTDKSRKYELWWDMGSPSGAGFSFRDFDFAYWFTLSGVGSRLVYRDRETAFHARDHFSELFKTWMVYDRSQQGK